MLIFFFWSCSLRTALPLSPAQQLFPCMTDCYSFPRTSEVKAGTVWLTILYFIKHWRPLQWVLIFKELRNIASPLIPLNKSQFNTIFVLLVITNELILEMNSKTSPKCFNPFPSIWKTKHKFKQFPENNGGMFRQSPKVGKHPSYQSLHLTLGGLVLISNWFGEKRNWIMVKRRRAAMGKREGKSCTCMHERETELEKKMRKKIIILFLIFCEKSVLVFK